MLSFHSVPQTAIPAGARTGTFWIDLIQATAEEIAQVETAYGVKVPSRAQLDEIEGSSRLGVVGECLYVSMPSRAQPDVIETAPTPIGFVLAPELLVTVGY